VLSTCAIDYLSWENEYEPGEATVGGLRVRRFPVTRRRTAEGFDALSSRVHFASHTDADERRWMEEHGPVTPQLLQHLRDHGDDYDAADLLLLPLLDQLPRPAGVAAQEHPGAHGGARPDGGPAPVSRPLPPAGGLRLQHPEEREMLTAAAGVEELPGEVVRGRHRGRAGHPGRRDPPKARRAGRLHRVRGPHRAGQGLLDLFDHFVRYVQEQGPHLNLVLVGKAVLPVPNPRHLAHLGVLSDADKLS